MYINLFAKQRIGEIAPLRIKKKERINSCVYFAVVRAPRPGQWLHCPSKRLASLKSDVCLVCSPRQHFSTPWPAWSPSLVVCHVPRPSLSPAGNDRERKNRKQLNRNHVPSIKMRWMRNKCFSPSLRLRWTHPEGCCTLPLTSFDCTMTPWFARMPSFVASISCMSTPRQQSSIKTVRYPADNESVAVAPAARKEDSNQRDCLNVVIRVHVASRPTQIPTDANIIGKTTDINVGDAFLLQLCTQRCIRQFFVVPKHRVWINLRIRSFVHFGATFHNLILRQNCNERQSSFKIEFVQSFNQKQKAN